MQTQTKKRSSIVRHLDFYPTSEQKQALDSIERFLKLPIHDTFILKGAAGTGKTSILKAIKGYVTSMGKESILIAPTGRAAKILSEKTGGSTGTIHSHIYMVKEVKDDQGTVMYVEFIRRNNASDEQRIYIIDEASMVGDKVNNSDYFSSKESLLTDLITFIKEGAKNNKIIFIGDPYQLPPISSMFSPALDENYLQEKFNLRVTEFELTEVKRQKKDSYILSNAEKLRNQIQGKEFNTSLKIESLPNENQLIEKYAQEINEGRAADSIFLAWKNVSINYLNSQIRQLLYPGHEKIILGERLVINQTNYTGHYLPSGTIVIVDQIIGIPETIAGFDFFTVKLRLADTEEIIDYEFKVDLQSLTSKTGPIDVNLTKKLWHERFKTNKELQRTKDARSDAYLSALKTRYAYAITTHKAQGGEWDNVYLYPETPFGPNGLKWLYTTVTRAKKHLYSFNP